MPGLCGHLSLPLPVLIYHYIFCLQVYKVLGFLVYKKCEKRGLSVPEAIYYCLCAIAGRNIDDDDDDDDGEEGTPNHQVETSRGEY